MLVQEGKIAVRAFTLYFLTFQVTSKRAIQHFCSLALSTLQIQGDGLLRPLPYNLQ